MHCSTIIKISNSDRPGDMGFGRGVILLLEGIDRFGSINRATRDMGMAYSKAWRIINSVEKELDLPLISRDGARGSSITPEGRKLMNAYYETLRAAEEAARIAFHSFYPEESGNDNT